MEVHANQLLIYVLSAVVEGGVRKPSLPHTWANLGDGEVEQGLVGCFLYLLRNVFERDLDDGTFRTGLCDLMVRLFHFYPYTGEERNRLADEIYVQASSSSESSCGGDLFVLKALLSTEAADGITSWNREETIARLCRSSPPLPELILAELAAWKARQRDGLELRQRTSQVDFRMQFLTYVLAADKNAAERMAGGDSGEGRHVAGFVFGRATLEEFWRRGMVSVRGEREPEVELYPSSVSAPECNWWGGDGVTDTVRYMFFHFLSQQGFGRFSGVVIRLPPFVIKSFFQFELGFYFLAVVFGV